MTIYCYIALFMWSVSLLFSKEYFAHYSHKARYYGFMLLTMFATLGVFLAKDLFIMFIFFIHLALIVKTLIHSQVWVIHTILPVRLPICLLNHIFCSNLIFSGRRMNFRESNCHVSDRLIVIP